MFKTEVDNYLGEWFWNDDINFKGGNQKLFLYDNLFALQSSGSKKILEDFR